MSKVGAVGIVDMPEIILASSSPYRKKQLADIGLRVRGVAPTADENIISADQFSPLEVAQKRAHLKTASVAKDFPQDIVIGGDQLVNLDGEILGKPGTSEKAVRQLVKMSGKSHELITACELHYQGRIYSHTDITRLYMHGLSEEEIKSYVAKDRPLNCAGSYKIESLGSWLFHRIETEDYTAITGLPLLFVTRVIRELQKSPLL